MPARITALAVVLTLGFLLGLAALATRGFDAVLRNSVDDELRDVRAEASAAVNAGRQPAVVPGALVRVLDTAGNPVDEQVPAELEPTEIGALKAGESVQHEPRDGQGPPVRWLGEVATAPDGAQRLVLAGAGLVGTSAAVADSSRLLFGGAALVAVLAGLATWFGVRSVFRPISRMRRSVRALPAGQRLPLPGAQDELRALAAEFNGLLERQERTTERLRRFTGDAAHELRSPVASIRVQAEVAAANPDPELTQETLTDVLAETERLSGLLDGLLTLARSDAGEQGPAEPVELTRAAHAALARLAPHPLETRVAGGAGPAWAKATHAEVELVLDNLMRNAARYAHTTVVVSVLSTRSWARVVVDDDGPGVASEDRQRVFDRFYRVGDDRARSSGGAGLGLAMVHETLRRRGGRVVVAESPEGGARFQVTWHAAGAGAAGNG